MPQLAHIDHETYSRADLRKVGAHRYSEDSSTLILLTAVAWDDDPPVVWDSTDPWSKESIKAGHIIEEISASGVPVYAHNAPFEMAINGQLWKKTFGCPAPELSRYRCTAALARRAAMPSSLGDLSEVLKLKHGKDKRGEALIKIFCQPRTVGKLKGQRIMPDDDGLVTVAGDKMSIKDAWQLFREYNRQDVRAEQEVYNILKPFDLKGITLRGFQFDARMNQRGVPVNRDAIRKAMKIVEEASAVDIARCRKLCGLEPTQVGKLLPWLRERGYPGENLQEKTMDECLEEPPKGMKAQAVEVLKIRSRVAFAAVKKLPTMLRACCADGRVRGMFMWSGAIRTHRWSGKIIQPQNFKRPTIKDTHGAYQAICDGWDHEMLSMVWGNAVEVVASSIRHFIHDEGCEFDDGDYSNIEARIVPWLAGQTSLVEAFRHGLDPYKMMASKVFNKPVEEINGDERFVGKQLVLGAGYQLGWEKFQAMCLKYGRDLDDDLCKTAIEVYREENDQIVSLWKAMQRAAVSAIEAGPGEVFTVRGRIKFGMSAQLAFPALLMRLPSGHHLVYPWPELKTIWLFNKGRYHTEAAAKRAKGLWRIQREKDKKAGKLTEAELEEEEPRVWSSQQISYFGPDPLSHQWGRRLTYGGSLTENATQAIAGDFISYGAIQAEKAGYEIFMLIHDQALAHHRPEKGNTVEGFRNALCTLPKWALDFPLVAECHIAPFYSKDS